MNLSLSKALLFAAGLAASSSWPAGVVAQTTQVCFYEHYQYQGQSQCATGPAGDVGAPVTGKVSSVRVTGAGQVTLYPQRGQAGQPLLLEGSVENLDARGFNNLTASFKVGTVDALPEVCFFEHYDHQGASFCSGAVQGDVGPSVLGKVSSVRVPAGLQVTLYQQSAQGGRSVALASSHANLQGVQFNNLTTSFRSGRVLAGTARQVLFIGNSFLHGNVEPTLHFNAFNVTDLNGSGLGGVPGVFKQLTVEAGLDYAVHNELVSGQTLDFHNTQKRPLIGSKSWDVVVMNEYSLLDRSNPGNPAKMIADAGSLARYVQGADNPFGKPGTQVHLIGNWPRADQVYPAGGHWAGKTVEAAGADLAAAFAAALRAIPQIASVVPVGDAFVRAIVEGVADRNPYDGVEGGKVSVWGGDHFHASAWGSYLEALLVFGRLTGQDPRRFGGAHPTARQFNLTEQQATWAQELAFRQLAASAQAMAAGQ